MAKSLDGLSYAEIEDLVAGVIRRLRERSATHRAYADKHQLFWDLHQPSGDTPQICRGCSQAWPCGTVAGLTV